MRLAIVTGGSRGDIQPLVALGVELRKTGHSVVLCGNAYFRDFVTAHGLEFASVNEADPREGVAAAHRRRPANPVTRVFRLFQRQPVDLDTLQCTWDACRQAEAIIFTPFSGHAYMIAEALEIACFAAYLHPWYPTGDFGCPMGLPPLPLGRVYNRLSHWLMYQLFWVNDRSAVNACRKKLGLSPMGWAGSNHWLHQRRVPFLFGFSPTLVPVPRDWPDEHHVTGFWFLEESAGWQPPAALVEFLRAGDVPVSVGFGSMVDPNSQWLFETVLDAVERNKLRAVVVGGWSQLGSLQLPKHVFAIDSIAYAWLFPRVAAAIHASGSGTVAEVLRAGIPSIPIPFAAEQRFYGRALARLGVAHEPIPRDQLSAGRLADALATLMADTEMRARSMRVAELVRVEDGVARAAACLNAYLRKREAQPVCVAAGTQSSGGIFPSRHSPD